MSTELQGWIADLVARDGTVLHLVPGQVPLARVGRQLEPLGEQALDDRAFVQALHAVCGEREQGVVSGQAYGGALLHGRVVNDAGRRTLVLRRLVVPTTAPSDVGLPDRVWEHFAGLRRGLVLLVGESGTGTTSACAALAAARLTDSGAHGVIIGDPLAWTLPAGRARVSHCIVGADAPTMAEGIRTAQRADADLICCTPLHEPDAVHAALDAARGGALVIATVTAASVPEAFSRLIDEQPATQRTYVTSQLSRAFELATHQALIVRADGTGRTLATGVLLPTPAVRNLLREEHTHQLTAMMMTGGKIGMRSLGQHIDTLIQEGTVEEEAAIAAHPEPHGLRQFLESNRQHREKQAKPQPPPGTP